MTGADRGDRVGQLLAAAAPLIELAIAEDVGPGDATSDATVSVQARGRAQLTAKQRGVVAGLPIAGAVFARVDPTTHFEPRVEDGAPVEPGEILATVTGSARSLLRAERIALNFLQHLSGIATFTKAFVDAVATTRVVILDTRKTLPGYRLLEKYAVTAGGGTNHRMGLYDRLLLKNNHIDLVGDLGRAAGDARQSRSDLSLEIEVRNPAELAAALELQPLPEWVMLDNFDVGALRAAVDTVAGRVKLEASGGVTLANVAEVAATGVDAVSVGALTHSAPALDIAMHLVAPGDDQTAQARRAAELRRQLGEQVMLLGHHYQRDEIIALADATGDSLQLAREATATDARFIVFCGVHFMAETAAALAKPGQQVLIPDHSAGCYLADTVDPAGIESLWGRLDEVLGDAGASVLPVTYVNSSASLKAFCGSRGGIVCTSSNAADVMRWALRQRQKVLFFPDQHLGANSARQLGIPRDEVLLWSRQAPASAESVHAARIILWPGACNVHVRFRTEDIDAIRARWPDAEVIVHPECRPAVVAAADDTGSTAHIIRRIAEAPAGSRWAVGTEARLVHRIQQWHPDKTVIPLSAPAPYCSTMSQITLPALLEQLEALAAGEPVKAVTLDAETSHWARLALQRMLDIST
jgi:quinolinate synthase